MNFPICSGLVVVDTFYTKVTGLRQFGTVNSTERPPQAKIFRNYNVFGKKGPSYKQLHSQWQCNCNAFTRIWNKHATRQPQLTNNKWCMWLSSLSPPSLSLSPAGLAACKFIARANFNQSVRSILVAWHGVSNQQPTRFGATNLPKLYHIWCLVP